jgi:hypothetical protein
MVTELGNRWSESKIVKVLAIAIPSVVILSLQETNRPQ